MVYVMSDIHGEYEKYTAMLERINFTGNDTLYVLGDVLDRGRRPADTLRDMMSRINVIPILGNHEIMALEVLKSLSVEITEENYETHLDFDMMCKTMEWRLNGGATTMKQFRELSVEDREAVLEYLEELEPYELIRAGGKSFLLVHSGLGNFDPGKELDDYSPEELAFMRADHSKKYFDNDNFYIVSGHTPTLVITGKAEIYKCNNNICIDCGAVFGGKLACLCLDTMEEFYV